MKQSREFSEEAFRAVLLPLGPYLEQVVVCDNGSIVANQARNCRFGVTGTMLWCQLDRVPGQSYEKPGSFSVRLTSSSGKVDPEPLLSWPTS